MAPYTIEPFDPDKHDRADFSCGVVPVDNYFKRTANKLARAGNTRLYVMIGAEDALIGFYALNAHVVDYRGLPPRYARTRPRHGGIPAAYISPCWIFWIAGTRTSWPGAKNSIPATDLRPCPRTTCACFCRSGPFAPFLTNSLSHKHPQPPYFPEQTNRPRWLK